MDGVSVSLILTSCSHSTFSNDSAPTLYVRSPTPDPDGGEIVYNFPDDDPCGTPVYLANIDTTGNSQHLLRQWKPPILQ